MKLLVLALLAGGLLAAPQAAITSAAAQTDSGETPPAEAPAAPSEGVSPAEPEAPTMASVHVIAENIESAKGTVRLALCNTALTVEGCPYQTSVPATTAGFVEATFENIPPGRYAVVGYHDLNDNNLFDKTLGVPREPYALSGAAADEMVPSFEDATLDVHAGPNDVIIRMKRLTKW